MKNELKTLKKASTSFGKISTDYISIKKIKKPNHVITGMENYVTISRQHAVKS
jgi:hypothetical protein